MCACSACSCRPLAASHSLIMLSVLPEAIIRPSGEKATEATRVDCNVRSSGPPATSQSLIVLSALPEAIVRPSSEKSTENTPARMPL